MVLKTLTKLIFIALAYFVAIKALIHVILALILIDLITGIWKSVKKFGWKSLNSRGYKRTVIKFAAYMLAIMTTFIIEAEILQTGIVVCRTVAGMIALVEFASIMENLSDITGQNVFMAMFDMLKTKLNTDKSIIDKIDLDKSEDFRQRKLKDSVKKDKKKKEEVKPDSDLPDDPTQNQ